MSRHYIIIGRVRCKQLQHGSPSDVGFQGTRKIRRNRQRPADFPGGKQGIDKSVVLFFGFQRGIVQVKAGRVPGFHRLSFPVLASPLLPVDPSQSMHLPIQINGSRYRVIQSAGPFCLNLEASISVIALPFGIHPK